MLFFTNYSDLSVLILSKIELLLSSLAFRLALTQVFLFLTYLPSSDINSSIIIMFVEEEMEIVW